jgi:transglutaminase-like putative cysteine protease
VTVLDAIRRANQPGLPEDSVRLRVACLGALLVVIAACNKLHEIAPTTALAAAALVTGGMVFSYVTRRHPPGWIKIVVAVGAIAACVWFFRSLTNPSIAFALVENPLTLLLVSVLAVHSFHVPARRDLVFSFAASAGLMAVAGAQAIDLEFGLYVAVWAGFCLWGLTEMWVSASSGGHMSVAGLLCTFAAVAVAAAVAFVFLPAPQVSVRVAYLARLGLGGSVGVPGALAGDGGTPAQLAQAGTTSGSTRVGGFLGFAKTLDTALRGQQDGNQLIMQVRAERPSFWVGETFDTWRGESWVETNRRLEPLREGSPFFLPTPAGDVPGGEVDLQTFYVAGSTANLVFHAEGASQLWFPAKNVFFAQDGTLVSPIGLGSGSIYTVESTASIPTAAQLRADTSYAALPTPVLSEDLQLPHQYPRVQALAASITAHDTTTYDKVQALIGWIGAHTRYSLDIPPLPRGRDSVDEFLFGNRVGYCEQISTSLAVMLRSLGIPTREAVGYVPGGYNPITDLYQVRASDAHAWVQVWFPGYGWQSFDPTAVVASVPPNPGTTALRDVAAALRRVPWIPVVAVGLGVAAIVAAARMRRWRPASWALRVTRGTERAGRRAGRPRHASETLPEYAASLDQLMESGSGPWSRLAEAVEASAYGGREPSEAARRTMVAEAKRTRIRRRTAVRT